MRTKTLALATVFSLCAAPSFAQVIIGGGGSGSGGGSGGTPANPTATAGPAAVNGAATTYMRSDAAPAVQKGSNAQFGIVEGDGSTVTCVVGVCSAVNNGTVTSVATGAGLTGGPVTTTGTIATTFATRAVVSTTDTILSTDAAKLVTYSNASPIAVTLPQATGSFAAGFAFSVQNLGVGLVTVTPTTSTVNGAASLTVPTNAGCDFVSDGTNWQIAACTAVAAKFTLTNATNYPQSSLTGLGTGVSTALGTNVSGSGAICLATGSACASSSSFNSNWVANNWYNATAAGAVGTGVNISATVTEWVPVYFDKSVTISAIGARVVTTSAGGLIKFAVYAADGTTGLPTGSALCSTATGISTTSATSLNDTCSAALTGPGRFWFGMQVDNATATVVSNNQNAAVNSIIGASSQANLTGSNTTAQTDYKTTGGTFGTWPTNPTISQSPITTNLVPLIQFKLASVP